MLTCPAFGGPSRSPLAPNLRPHAWHPSRAGTRCLSMAGPRLILARTPSGSCNSSSSHGHASQRASPAYRKCSPFPNLASALSVRGIGARPPTWLRASFAPGEVAATLMAELTHGGPWTGLSISFQCLSISFHGLACQSLASLSKALVLTVGSEYGCRTFTIASASTDANGCAKGANLGPNFTQQRASATPEQPANANVYSCFAKQCCW